IVSTTDPAAVIGIFRDVGAPRRLSILAEGESLFNDAVAIAAFVFFLELLVHGSGNSGGLVVHVFREFLGGILFGYVMARVAIFFLPRRGEWGVAFPWFPVSLAYAS